MQSAFGSTPAELIVENDDTGVNKTLEAIHAKYLRKANYLSAMGVRPAKDGLYYENAAARIAELAARDTTLKGGQLFFSRDGENYEPVGEVTDITIA